MSRNFRLFAFALSCLAYASVCQSAKILGYFTSPPKSHLIVNMAVATALADQGHNVTVVTTSPYVDKNPNYRNIKLDIKGLGAAFFTELIHNPKSFYDHLDIIGDNMLAAGDEALSHPRMKQLLEEETFDLVIFGYFFNEFQLGVAAHFKCPVIVNYVIQPFALINNFVGNPAEVAYVPAMLSGIKQPMVDFLTRVKNFYYTEILEGYLLHYQYERKLQRYYRKHFPADKYPSLDDMRKNVSMVFVNHHFSQKPIRPNVPAMVEIGGIQIKQKAEPLPINIKSFLDSANETGAIYFSLGTNVKSDVFDQQKAKVIFNVLSKLPQKVLWKWDDSNYPGNSGNILFQSWLPQNDILSHPNVRLFITHGGQGGVVESQYHGVPMLGIPLFGDQATNMAHVEKSGFGLSVDFKTMAENSFRERVIEVLTNKVYKERVKLFSDLYKDRPMSPQDTVRYWTNYVLRHRGAAHMQSPVVHMNAFQSRSLDVIGFVLVCLYVVVKITIILIKFVVRQIFQKKSQIANKDKTN